VALKALRGDFRGFPRPASAEDRAEVARWEGEGGPAAPGTEGAHERQDREAAKSALRAARL
jgi:hypothetical protein